MAPKKQAVKKEDPIKLELPNPEGSIEIVSTPDADLNKYVRPSLAVDDPRVIVPSQPLKKGASDIQGRFMVLMATRQDHLVDWVMSFPNMPNLKSDEYVPSQEALAAAILVHEYGTVAYLDWRLKLDREKR